jgi:hypothetical protein
MKLHISTCLVVGVLFVMLIAGCGGSGGSTPPPPPQSISVAFSPAAPTSASTGSISSLTAAVSNDSANAGIKWSVTCGNSQCGTFSTASTASGAATQYSAPGTIPSPANVTVTATSVTDPTKSASAAITITTPPPPAHVLNDGNYVFHVSGEDGSGPYFVAGAFTVQNSVISGGEQDMMDDNGNSHDNLVVSGSSMSIVNGNIQIVLNTGDTSVGVNGVETFRGTVVTNARVLLSQYDTFATATGSIDQQTSAAAPAGGYAFNVGGLDGVNPQNNLVIGGILNISGAAISVGNSVFDYNDGGNVAQNQSFASGTVSAPDSFGRVVFTLNPSSSSGLPSFAVAGYTVGTNQIQLVETTDTLSGDFGGVALGQGSNTGRFNQAGVGGNSYAFEAMGQDNTTNGSNIVQMAGGFGLNANGTVSGNIALNDLDVSFGSQITSGQYTVDPTGRLTISLVTTVSPANAPAYTIPFSFQLYLDGNGNALELGVDNSQATSGLSFVQTAPSADFEGNYALNVFGFSGINNEPAWASVGPVTVASDAFTGYTDFSVQNAANSASAVTPAVSLSGSEDSSTGLLVLNGLYATLDPTMQSGFGYYPIDANRVIAIELDNNNNANQPGQLGLMMLEAVQPN